MLFSIHLKAGKQDSKGSIDYLLISPFFLAETAIFFGLTFGA